MRSTIKHTEHKARVVKASFNRRAISLQLGLARKFFALAITALLLSSGLIQRAEAADGDLDPTFGADGKVTTQFSNPSGIRAVAIQTDAKIVAAGVAGFASALARYNPDGSLDQTFGTGGKIETPVSACCSIINAIAIQTDGKIVGVGYGYNPIDFPQIDFALARYNPDGTLDQTFGFGGQVTTDFFGRSDQALDLRVQPDGHIVVCGLAPTDPNDPFAVDVALARYGPNGSLDPSFGNGGKVTTDFFGSEDRAASVAIQSDGKIVIAGNTYTSFSTNNDFLLARYTVDGSLDQTFGLGGKTTTDFFGEEDVASDHFIQADGKIVVAGAAAGDFQSDFALARYNPDGSLDQTFGASGQVTTDFFGKSDRASALAALADGRIVLAGQEGSFLTNFALARYNPNGSLDPTFGSGGKVTTDFPGNQDFAFSVAIQGDGKLVAAGYSQVDFASDFALARYLGPAAANLSVIKRDSPDPVVAGQNITYTIIVTNNGPDAASNVTVTDIVPPGTTFQSLNSPAGWVCLTPPVNGTGTITCATTSLELSHPAVFTLIVKVNALAPDGSSIDNRVIVGSDAADPNPNNNSASVRTSVIGFKFCIQDDDDGNTFQFNSTTGDYLFTKCGAPGFALSGTGVVRNHGCNVSLEDSAADRTVLANFNACNQKGNVLIKVFGRAAFDIKDKDTTDNTCSCL